MCLTTPLYGQEAVERRSRVAIADSLGDDIEWEAIRALLDEAGSVEAGGIGAEVFRVLPGNGLGSRLVLRDGTPATSGRRTQRGGVLGVLGREGLGRPNAVSGPAAARFTTDLGAGVTDLRTATPSHMQAGTDLTGAVGYSYGIEREQHRPWGDVALASDGWLVQGFGSLRTTSGTTATQDLERSSGVFGGSMAARLGEQSTLSLRYDGYRGDRSSNDRAENENGPTVERSTDTPRDDVDRIALRYEARNVGLGVADAVGITLWGMRDVTDDESRLVLVYGRPALDATTTESFAHARSRSGGARLEATARLGDRHLVRYGASLTRESVDGRDSTHFLLTRDLGPDLEGTETGTIPSYRDDAADLFAVGSFSLAQRLGVILSARHEWHRLARRDTALAWNDQVSALGMSLQYRPDHHWALHAGVSYAGRAPTAQDRLGRGLNLRGEGYVDSTGALETERALIGQAGLRYASRQLVVSGTLFAGATYDAIRLTATGDTLLGVPILRRGNSGTLRQAGAQLTAVLPNLGPLELLASGGYSRNEMTDGSWRNAVRILGSLSWPATDEGWYLGYEVIYRSGISTDDPHLAEQDLPDFVLQNLRGRLRIGSVAGTRHYLGAAVTNLFDERWDNAAWSGLATGLGREFTLTYRIDF